MVSRVRSSFNCASMNTKRWLEWNACEENPKSMSATVDENNMSNKNYTLTLWNLTLNGVASQASGKRYLYIEPRVESDF